METTNTGLLNDYLTRPQLCQQLGISARTLIRWDSMRIGPPVTLIGRRAMYKRSSVETWLQEIEGKDMKQLEYAAQRAAHERGMRNAAKA